MAKSTPLHQLADHDQSVWIDFLWRELSGPLLACSACTDERSRTCGFAA